MRGARMSWRFRRICDAEVTNRTLFLLLCG